MQWQTIVNHLRTLRPGGEKASVLGTVMAAATGALAAVVVVPIAWYMFHDVQRALFLLMGWALAALIVVGVVAASRYMLRLGQRPDEVPGGALTRPVVTPAARVTPPAMSPGPSYSMVAPGPARGGLAEPELDPAEAPMLPLGREGHTLTWAELVAAGIITAEDFYMGWDMLTRRPIRASWDEGTGSILNTGASWSGKTVLFASWAAQCVWYSRRPCLLIGDSDAGNQRSLTSYLAPLEPYLIRPVETTPAGILELGREAVGLIEARVAAPRRGEAADLSPRLWLVEEWGDVYKSEVGPAILECLETVARRGSKVRVWAGVVAQLGTKEAVGDVHGLLTTRLAFRQTDPNQVRYAVGVQLDNTKYENGQFVGRIRQRFVEWAQAPLVTTADLAALVADLPPLPVVARGGSPSGSQGGSPPELATVVALRPRGGSPSGSPFDAQVSDSVANPGEGGSPGGSHEEEVSPDEYQRIVRASRRQPRPTPHEIAREVWGDIRGGTLTRRAGLVWELVQAYNESELARLRGNGQGQTGAGGPSDGQGPGGMAGGEDT